MCSAAGSRDTSLIIWDALPWPPRTRGAPALPLATSPRRVLYGHDDGVRSDTSSVVKCVFIAYTGLISWQSCPNPGSIA